LNWNTEKRELGRDREKSSSSGNSINKKRLDVLDCGPILRTVVIFVVKDYAFAAIGSSILTP
jgi:hypothetical protein